jgi:hypothetical protein
VPGSTVLKCEQITTLPKANIHETAFGGKLPPTILRAVERAVLYDWRGNPLRAIFK